jgi:prophage maintenance system killer protein
MCCYRGITMWSGAILDPLAIGDLLVIAERETGLAAERLKGMISLSDAILALHAPFPDPGQLDLYPHPVEKAAVCCSRLIRAHLFPDGNKRIAFECMCEMLARIEYPWSWEPAEAAEIETKLNRLQAGSMTEREFVAWVWERLKA